MNESMKNNTCPGRAAKIVNAPRYMYVGKRVLGAEEEKKRMICTEKEVQVTPKRATVRHGTPHTCYTHSAGNGERLS